MAHSSLNFRAPSVKSETSREPGTSACEAVTPQAASRWQLDTHGRDADGDMADIAVAQAA